MMIRKRPNEYVQRMLWVACIRGLHYLLAASLDIAASLADKVVKVSEQSLDGDHVHDAQVRVRRLEDLAAEQNTNVVLSINRSGSRRGGGGLGGRKAEARASRRNARLATATLGRQRRSRGNLAANRGSLGGGADEMTEAVVLVALVARARRRFLAVNLKDDLRAHAGPDHGINLQDRQQAGHRTIVSDVVEVNDVALASNDVADVASQLEHPDAEGTGAGRERVGVVAVDLAVLPVTETVDGLGLLLGHAGGRVLAVDELAGQRLVVALTGAEVVVVVVKRSVEAAVAGRDTGDVVEGSVQRSGASEVLLPGGVAARLDRVEEVVGVVAAVLGLEAVDAVALDHERRLLGGLPHAVDNHTSDLAGDDVVGHAVAHVLGHSRAAARQEAKEIVVDAVEVGAMLPRVLEAASSDLGKLAGADPARGHKRVDGRNVPSLVHAVGVVAGKGLAVVEEARVVAVPVVGLDREGIGSVGRALVVTMHLQVSPLARILLSSKVASQNLPAPRIAAHTRRWPWGTRSCGRAACCTSCTRHTWQRASATCCR